MRELARFAMKAPRNAAGVAFVACLVPMMFWLGAATVALVTLRHGTAKGLNVFVWAAIPALGWWLGLQDPTALVVLISTFALAEVLRISVSMRRTLLFGFGFSILIGVLTPLLMPGAIEMLLTVTDELLKQLAEDAQLQVDDELKASFYSLMIASFAASFFAMSVASLFLARYWQAALFNPGGWRDEFNTLRMGSMDMTAIVIVMLIGPAIGLDGYLLVFSGLVPIIVCGFALVHGLIGKKNLGGHWMIGFYALFIVLFPTLLAIVVLMALIDSAVDIRSRVQASPDSQ